MGPDLGAEAVLERRDDPAAARVVLRVGGRDHEQVERQADREAADLDVALLEDVEQADLDPLGQVRQLVEREDPAVGTRDEAVVEGQLVRQVAALGDPDRVHLADQVGDRDVGGRELLRVAAVPVDPVDRGDVAALGDDRPCRRADRGERVVVELAAADHRQPLVEQVDEGARKAGLGLSSLAEEDDVLAGEERVLDRREDGLVVADDAREGGSPGARRADEVGAQLLLDRPRLPARVAQLSDRAGEAGRRGVGG